MAVDIATLGLNVDASKGRAEVNAFGQSLDNLSGKGTSAVKGLQTAFLGLSGTLAAGFLGRKFVDETVSAQYALAQLENTVRATGGAAGRSVEDLVAMSEAMQQMSVYADDAIQGGLARLLAYTSITGPTFDRAAQAVLNFASAYRLDLVQAAETVGKALEYPANATAALSRQGFRFSEEQQKVIQALVDTGRQAEAQALILDSLEVGIENAAAAARDTLGGALAHLANKFGDLFEVSREGTGPLIAAINALAENMGGLVRVATLTAIAFGAAGLLGAMPKLATAVVLLEHRFLGLSAAIAASRVVGTGFAGVIAGIAPQLIALGAAIPVATVAFFAFQAVMHSATERMAAYEKQQTALQQKTDEYTKSLEGQTEAQLQSALAQEKLNVANLAAEKIEAGRRAVAAQRALDLTPATRGNEAEIAALTALVVTTREKDLGLLGQIAEVMGRVEALQAALTKAASLHVDVQAALLKSAQEEFASLQDKLTFTTRNGALLTDIARTQQEIAALEREIADAAERALSADGKTAAERKKIADDMERAADAAQRFAEESARAAQRAAEEKARRAAATADYLSGLRQETVSAQQSVVLAQLEGKERERAALAFQKVNKEAANLARFGGENVEALNEANAEVERWYNTMLGIVDSTDDTNKNLGAVADGFAQAFSAASGLLSVLGDSGRELLGMVNAAAQLATNIGNIQKIKDSEGNAVGLGGALSGAAGASGVASAVSSSLGIIGAVVAIADALDLFANKAKERAQQMEEAALQFEDAIKAFANGGDAVTAVLNEAKQILTEFAQQSGFKINVKGMNEIFSSIEAMVEELNRLPASAYRDMFEDLVIATQKHIAEIEKQLRREQERATQDLAVRNLRAAGLDDEADALAFSLAQQREHTEAVDKFGVGAYTAALAQTHLAEAQAYAAEQARKAAEETERLAEANRRFGESLTVRGFAAGGDTRAAEDAQRIASNRQELADAIKDGMSETNIALLKFVQFAEAAAVARDRAIEDGTNQINEWLEGVVAALDQQIKEEQRRAEAEQKVFDELIKAERAALDAFLESSQDQIEAIQKAAEEEIRAIDEQIKAERESLSVAKEQVSALEQSVAATERVVESLRNFGAGLSTSQFSPLSPLQQYADLRQQLERADPSQIPDLAQRFLEASRKVNASGAAYTEDFRRVQQLVAAALTSQSGKLSSEQLALEEARKTVDGIERQIDLLQQQKDEIKLAAANQVAAIRDLMDAAKEASDATIDLLQQQKQEAADASQAIIDGLESQKEQARADAQAAIDALIETQNAIYQAAIEAHEYYGIWQDHTSALRGEIWDYHREDVEQADTIIDRLEHGNNLAIAAAQENREDLRGIRDELAQLRNQSRRGAGATV